ncbi:DUF4233 domain-containing protein [Oryzobacter telluris]|uniref:DUF4233 domain-containing protein n=1 Tax=Oryzobacter telluris TaxID=3149179 RepID=UPI00370DA820
MSRLPLYGRQGKFTYRLLAIALFGQSVILSFFALVARGNAIAAGEPEKAGPLLWLGLGLAVLALLGSGLMRSPVGITVGWLVQVLTWVSAFVVPVMIGVGVVFTLLWVVLLLQGLKVDALVARREAEAAAGRSSSRG